MAKPQLKQRPAIPVPLLTAMAEYCRMHHTNTVELMTAILRVNAHPDARPSELAEATYRATFEGKALALLERAQSVTVKPMPIKPLSPHAPVQKAKLPYWFKVITSLDFNDVNAYGVKGKFVNQGDIGDLPNGSIVMAMLKNGKHKRVYLLSPKKGGQRLLEYYDPKGTSNLTRLAVEATSIVVTSDPNAGEWQAIFEMLHKRGIPKL